ncbi:MAG: hypothetical protein GJ680_19130 [Alteromonadaceae bacterium]|nr:hypothetical protein [Alteromonadaceae bacterium]
MTTSHQLVNQSSGDVELYTPPDIVEMARQVLGSIDLDPASSEIANQRVQAKKIFTEKDDGLKQEWVGKVWLNHPFGARELPCKKNCKKKICGKRGYHRLTEFPGNAVWMNKLHESYTNGRVSAALCITYASTSEKWFKVLKEHHAICFIDGRTGFYLPSGQLLDSNTKGCSVTYFGNDLVRFNEIFSQLGTVMVPFSRLHSPSSPNSSRLSE